MSAGCFDNASCLYKMNEDHFPKNQVEQKQGIVSVLSSDFNSNKILLPFHNSSNSIRRTLSADMSSQKWLQNNGIPHSSVKRVKSSLQLQAFAEDKIHDSNNNEKGPAFEEIWSSIQADKKSWGCILSPQKKNGSDSDQVAPPYVHPLVKRTGSSLSEKSLEICTESLGSETGSDGFSYPSSDSDQEAEEEQEEEEEEEETEVKGYNNNNVQQVVVGINKLYNSNSVSVRGPTSKRSMMVPPTRPSSFPPPLPSLAHRDDGSNLRIRSHRQDGRLVVEAVSVPSQNCFRAQRQDGRLLLTFTSTDDGDDDDNNETNYIQNNDVKGEKQERIQVMEDDAKGVMNVQRKRPSSCTAMTMMTKVMDLTNKSTTWPRNYNTTVIKTLNNNNNNNNSDEDEDEDEDEDDEVKPMTQSSLPPRPAKSSTTALNNAYEYYWRRSNSTTVAMLKPFANTASQNNTNISTNTKKCVGKHTKRNSNKLLYGYATHNLKKGVAFTHHHHYHHHEQLVVPAGRGSESLAAAEYVMPLMFRGCKEAKKPSLLLREPYCIATT
ncbi:Protein FAF-like chloroplastic [Bienertia sinuspersici]